MDRISGLPNEIICHIVSFLSAKEAAFTTGLSKRFQNLFTIIPNLRFDDTDKDEIQGSFTDFVDRVLALPASSRVRNFSIRFDAHNDLAEYVHINRCLCAMLKRGILNLELDIDVERQYSLPFELFTCKTVVELKLCGRYGSGFVVDVLPENAFLPAVEILVLNLVQFKDLRGCAFEKLLSACPVLRELIIEEIEWEHWKWSGKLSSPTLKRLMIRHGDYSQCDPTRITLDTPSLTYLDYSDVVPGEYPIHNLDSLVEANLDLMLAVDHNFDGDCRDFNSSSSDPTNLIKGLGNVAIMNLQFYNTFQAFFYFHEAIPVFKNLYHLTITIDHNEFCWRFLPHLLEKSPNLKTLVIDGPLHYSEALPQSVCDCLSEYTFLLSCPLEVLKITDYCGTSGEVEQLKHFLEKLSCLKLVKLHSPKRRGLEKKMIMLPRASSKCKIKVTFE